MAAGATVGEEGRLASDPQPGLGCVETLGGRVCELGAPVDPRLSLWILRVRSGG